MRRAFFSIIMFSIFIFVVACSDTKDTTEKNEEIITPVEVASVETGDFVVGKTMYGHISPIKQTPVMVQQPGEIRTLKVENGDEVKKDKHLATIRTPMGNQTIYAPTEGEIAHLNVQEGAFQSNEEPLAMIVDLDTLKISFTVSSTTREQFKKDDKIKVFIDEKEYEATVLPVDTLPNETGQFLVEAKIENKEHDILPGMTGQIAVTDKKVKDTIIVPTEAIMTENEQDFIFLVQEDVAKIVNVEIVETQTDKTAIKAELKKGDQIIVNGQFTLSDGSKVEVVKEGKSS